MEKRRREEEKKRRRGERRGQSHDEKEKTKEEEDDVGAFFKVSLDLTEDELMNLLPPAPSRWPVLSEARSVNTR